MTRSHLQNIFYCWLILFFYVLFSQIYPFLHFHAGEGGEKTAQPIPVFSSVEECHFPHDKGEHDHRKCDKEHFKVQVVLSTKQLFFKPDVDNTVVLSDLSQHEQESSAYNRSSSFLPTPVSFVASLQSRSPPEPV